MTLGGVFAGFAGAGRADPWNSAAFQDCFWIAVAGAIIVLGTAGHFGYEWLKRRKDGGDDVPQRSNPKKPKGGRTTPKGTNAGVKGKKVQQNAEQITNIGQQNNYERRTGPTLIGGKAWGNGGDGFHFGRGVKPHLEGNESFDNGGGGFHFEGDDPQKTTPPRGAGAMPEDQPIESGPTAELMEKLLQVPKEDADEVHRNHDQS